MTTAVLLLVMNLTVTLEVNFKSGIISKCVLTIGDVSERANVATSALRFYEREGLIGAVRTSGGQRRYQREVLRRIAFIRAAQRVGLTLDEIKRGAGHSSEGPRAHPQPTAADWKRLSRSWRPPPRPAHPRRAGAGAGQAGLLHRLRLPVPAYLPPLQSR